MTQRRNICMESYK